MNRYTVARRWRGNRATLTLHRHGCPSVRRADVAQFLTAPDGLRAGVAASTLFRSEVTVGTSHWGAECRCMLEEETA